MRTLLIDMFDKLAWEFSQFDLAAPPHAVPIFAPNFDVTNKLASYDLFYDNYFPTILFLFLPFLLLSFHPTFLGQYHPDYIAPSPFYPASAPSTSSNDSGTNYKKQAITVPHLDVSNLSRGWRAITALGWFDPDLGGHLTLWDLKLVRGFPLGATILIPSAMVRHSNCPI
ncbi:hypothetical protein C8F04DRAFT_1264968 [Mycena alexandri]|uniref:Uncharacterized protein n=1 Tax=Mycena alexandri TaxID=1745969 RepID=A0AAD6WW21_9AGAR|nr:hypothetical protein C8F04DRAFT_1264968 [Mycena alexandri]